MNTITLEFSPAVEAKLDKIIELLEAAQIVPAEQPTEAQKAPEPKPLEINRPAAETSQKVEEKPAPASTVTLEQIQQKVVQLAAIGEAKKAKVREVMRCYGSRVSDLKEIPDKWSEVWERLCSLESEG